MPLRLSRNLFVGLFSLTFVLLFLPVHANPKAQQSGAVDFMFKSNLKTVLAIWAGSMKMNLLFDSSVKDRRIEFEAKKVTMREVFDKLLHQESLASMPFDRNTILVFQDTPEDKRRVQEATAWTIKNLEQTKGAKDNTPSDDWLKMLQEFGRKERPGKHSFKGKSLRASITDLAKKLDYVVIFDEAVKEKKLDFEFLDVTPTKAMVLLLLAEKLQARVLDERTVLVFVDKTEKYESLKSSWIAFVCEQR